MKFQAAQDYQNSLTGGHWVIFGHYLAVQPWSPDFNTQQFSIKHIMGWVRLPRLPAHYYHKSVIRQIGSAFGEVIRIDYNTESGDRGKFTRLAVNLDLTKPLVSKVQVDGQVIYAEYEGLPLICFHCGRYGHLKEGCPETKQPATEAQVSQAPQVARELHSHPLPPADTRESTPFGEWMQAPRQKRLPVKGEGKLETRDTKRTLSGSRFAVLGHPQPSDEHVHQSTDPARPLLRGEPSKIWRKVAEPRQAEDTDRTRVAPPTTPARDKAPILTHQLNTSLDTHHHSAVCIEDPRQSPHQPLPKPG